MIGVEVDYPLGATILKKKFSKMNPGQIAAKKKRNKFGSNIMFIQNCEISLCLSPLLVFFFVPDDTMKSHSVLTSLQFLYCKTVILQCVTQSSP